MVDHRDERGDDVDDLVVAMVAHLEATESIALPDRVHRWLGEAHAAAADAVGDDVSEDVVQKRATQVAELLAHVDETGNRAADEHVQAARTLATRIVETEGRRS